MANTNSKLNLLLVDDSTNNLTALEAVLAGDEYNLICVKSGPEALEKIESNDIALVLLDIQMPEMDGFETARLMKLSPRGKDIPIIFITAVYKEDPFIKKGYDVGAIDYFGKPFDPEILRMKVGIYTSFYNKTHLLEEREKNLGATEGLMQAGKKLAGILDSLTVGVIIVDAAGHVVQTNEEISRIWGFEKIHDQDDYGQFLIRWEADSKSIKSGPIARALGAGEYSKNELITIRCFDGSTKNVLASTSPLRSMDRKIEGVVVVVQDISEHKSIDQKTEQGIQKLINLGIELGQTNLH